MSMKPKLGVTLTTMGFSIGIDIIVYTQEEVRRKEKGREEGGVFYARLSAKGLITRIFGLLLTTLRRLRPRSGCIRARG